MFSLSSDSTFALCLVMAICVVGFLLVAVAFVSACRWLDDVEDAAREWASGGGSSRRDGGCRPSEVPRTRRNPAPEGRHPIAEHMRIPGRLR